MDNSGKSLKLFIFFCSNSLDADEFGSAFSPAEGDEYKIISLPCSGKANFQYFVKAFETGADGMVLITCAKGGCRFLEGNLRAHKRAGEVGMLLREIGMGPDRIEVLAVDPERTEIGNIVADVNAFRGRLREMKVRV